MDSATMLAMLKIDLGITATAYDTRLGQLLDIAKKEIEREGVTLHTNTVDDDANLVIMYAAWLWRRRDTMEGMPRMIRYALNNRVFAEKMNTEQPYQPDEGIIPLVVEGE